MTSPVTREAGGASASATVQPVERREWWPAAFLDETMPAGRSTPDAWLCGLNDGLPAYGIPGDEEYPPRTLKEGDVVIFDLRDRLGRSRLTFSPDGAPIWSPPVPCAVNHLWDGDELIGDTPAEIAEWILEAEGADHTTEVMLSRWSAHDVRFRFTALDGPPCFVPLDPIPEPPGIFLAPPADPQSDIFATQERL